MWPISLAEFSKPHPFVPVGKQVAGVPLSILRGTGNNRLRQHHRFRGRVAPANSGAQGEFAGLMVIRAYLILDRGRDTQRDIAWIPASAHVQPTPPAPVMAGMRVVVVARHQGKEHRRRRPAGQGRRAQEPPFEGSVERMGRLRREHPGHLRHSAHERGQLYMDGANMNAQVGLTNPAAIGADVCHLNCTRPSRFLTAAAARKSPIAVAAHLAPGHPVAKTGGTKAIHALARARWSSAYILLISVAHLRNVGVTA